MGGMKLVGAQDDILQEGLGDHTFEVPWATGARNFRLKLLHRFDGVVIMRVEGAANTQKGRDMVARALAGAAESVLRGEVRFE